MHTQEPVRRKQERAHKIKRVLRLLAVLLSAAALVAYLQKFYFARELFLFFVLAASLVFVGASLAVLGIVIQEGERSLLRYIRKANSRIARPQESVPSALGEPASINATRTAST